MQMTQSLDWDSLRSFFKKHARFLFCLVASLMAGLAAHGYFYTGIGFSQDSLMLYRLTVYFIKVIVNSFFQFLFGIDTNST